MPRPRLGAEPMTDAQKQARRREQFRQMREALERIAQAKTIREARAIAAEGLQRSDRKGYPVRPEPRHSPTAKGE